jgi:5-methyltetrahydropteroyltriglutamate--homocysteine methyltransferase
MYDWTVSHTDGFERRGSVRAFDNKYYTKAAVTGPVALRSPFHNAEFSYLSGFAEAELKIPVTGAYTIGDWSFDEHYFTAENLLDPARERRKKRKAARRQFILDIARNVIRPNVQELLKLGAWWVQIDEPGASTETDELDLFVDSFNATVEGLDGMFSTHLCFSDYNLFFPAIERMSECKQYAVGFANYDSRELGTAEEKRPGYHVIKKFRDLSYKPILGLGVLDIHSDFIESPELVRDRVIYAVNLFKDPARIHVMPDCGLRTRSWKVAYEKLKNMSAGVALAKKELGLSS